MVSVPLINVIKLPVVKDLEWTQRWPAPNFRSKLCSKKKLQAHPIHHRAIYTADNGRHPIHHRAIYTADNGRLILPRSNVNKDHTLPQLQDSGQSTKLEALWEGDGTIRAQVLPRGAIDTQRDTQRGCKHTKLFYSVYCCHRFSSSYWLIRPVCVASTSLLDHRKGDKTSSVLMKAVRE
ncbi:hypothetical protein RRG08_057634 [Elysia crispata]|uniref:Uncharacterized protein n=1 Tax=Elysia crispata TaxID=231223 RepID=A0AAE1DQM0_9GAST|nr:hypothetical protein RRG08_057634 [Elysia crispata]